MSSDNLWHAPELQEAIAMANDLDRFLAKLLDSEKFKGSEATGIVECIQQARESVDIVVGYLEPVEPEEEPAQRIQLRLIKA